MITDKNLLFENKESARRKKNISIIEALRQSHDNQLKNPSTYLKFK